MTKEYKIVVGEQYNHHNVACQVCSKEGFGIARTICLIVDDLEKEAGNKQTISYCFPHAKAFIGKLEQDLLFKTEDYARSIETPEEKSFREQQTKAELERKQNEKQERFLKGRYL